MVRFFWPTLYSANLHNFDSAATDFVRNVDVARKSLPETFHRDIRSSKWFQDFTVRAVHLSACNICL